MANYDWFDRTPEDYRREAEHEARLQSRGYAELGYPKKQLVCTLCGSMIYGTIDEQWATLHRTVCVRQTPGRHRKNF